MMSDESREADTDAASWLTGVLLGASAAEVPSLGTLTSPSGNVYQLLEKVGDTPRFNLYLCLLPSGRSGVLKIAATTEHNEALNNEVLVLRLLRARAEEVEAGNKGPAYNYDVFFPTVVESFISNTQGDRRVSILGFAEVIENATQLTPLTRLTKVEHVRVDPKTVAWIVGKLLKVLSFAHDQGIANRLVASSNVLIEREQHGVVLFDWTNAQLYPDGRVPTHVSAEEIAQAASLTFTILGGDPEKGVIPESEQLTDDRFVQFLHSLVRGHMSNALKAHGEFYELIYGLWPRGFHKFTTYSLEEQHNA